jgi:GST-like protein
MAGTRHCNKHRMALKLTTYEVNMTENIQLYYWPTPNGWKITIALEEMGLPYDIHLINLGNGEQFSDEFAAISPNRRMPAIIDPDGPGGQPISIFESGAILQYLARKTGKFYGETERQRIAVDEWLMWQMGGLGPMAGQAFHFLKYAPSMQPPHDLPYAKDRYRNEISRLFGVLDDRLKRNQYIAGDFYSIADMAIWPWVSLWRGLEQSLDERPGLARWLEELKQRPQLREGRAQFDEARIKPQENPEIHKVVFGQKG